MSIRTTPGAVQKVLQSNYGPDRDGNEPDISPYIKTASIIVDRISVLAAEEELPFSTAEKTELECWLAAHFYTIMDPLFKAKRTLDASGDFYDRSYLDVAKMLDPTGLLPEILEGVKRAKGYWLGLNPPAQTDFVDR